MERYGSGTRVLLSGRSRSDIVYQTTVGSPVRYDAAIVSGCVQLPGYSTVNSTYCQMPIVGPRTSITATPAFFSLRGQYTGGHGGLGNGLQSWIELVKSNGQVVAKLANNAASGSTFGFYVYNGSGFIAVGPSYIVPLNVLNKYDIKAIPGVGGELSLWVNGVSVISNIGGLNANFDSISFIRMHNFGQSANAYISEYGAADEDLRSYNFGDDVLTANGFYNDGTGDAADTGDTDLSTYKGLPANLDKFTGTGATRTLPGNTVIDGIMLSTVSRTSSPIGNAKGLLRMSGSDFLTAAQSPAPTAGFEYGQVTYDVDPNTGLPWVLADYNSAEKGQEANT
jgi:hypothetical protein